jgi:hypothetical protein
MALGIIRTRITAIETRRVKAPEKTADSIYHTPEYRRWRAGVIARAGGRCEHVTDGVRCTKGSRSIACSRTTSWNCGMAVPFDLDNGRCLCGGHHTAKTAAARAERRAR